MLETTRFLKTVARYIDNPTAFAMVREFALEAANGEQVARAENMELRRAHGQTVRDLKQALKSPLKHGYPPEFSEHGRVVLRRTANGDVEENAHCPTCLVPLFGAALMCPACEYTAPFTPDWVEMVRRMVLESNL